MTLGGLKCLTKLNWTENKLSELNPEKVKCTESGWTEVNETNLSEQNSTWTQQKNWTAMNLT